ncbi:MAG TPA: dihydropyrimidinase [Candidatus Limnocylindrales bacterium]
MAGLLIRGGTVVSAKESFRADVVVRDGRIERIDREPPATVPDGQVVIDATDLLVLPGCVDVHTHTRIGTDAEPDRFYQDSVAAAFGGTTSFLSFNTPSSDSSAAAARSLVAGMREWRAATDGDSAIDYGLSVVLRGGLADPVAELPAVVDAGVPTAKAFMVYDFRLPDAVLYQAMGELGRLGGMLQVHCEDPVLIDTAVASALQGGNTAPRFHAITRSREAEAVATHRATAFARQARAPVYVVHLSCDGALDEVRRAKRSGVRAFAETCPHYLALTSDRYQLPDAEAVRFVISPPLREASDRDALWGGLADGSLDVIGTDHVPDRLDREKAEAARGVPFDRISNGAPGIETLLTIAWTEGVAAGRISRERLVDLLATTPARLFGLRQKGAIEVGRDADLVLFDPEARRILRATELHHTSDYTAYEGMPVRGAVRSVFVRGEPVIRDGAFVGRRGFGRFVERSIDA